MLIRVLGRLCPSEFDLLPTDDQLRILKELCQDAYLFSIILKLNRDIDIASEDETEDETEDALPQVLLHYWKSQFLTYKVRNC